MRINHEALMTCCSVSLRDPFFDAMTHDDDDDDDDEEEDGFYHDGYRGEQQDPFDSAWRFGFSMGPDGMRIQEPPVFGHVLREMEEIFSQMGHWDVAPESGHFGTNTGPSIKGSVCRIKGHLVVKLHIAAEHPSPHPPRPNMENLWWLQLS